MELTEKNGHASIEEILASVRRIIAEEPAYGTPLIDLDVSTPTHHPRGDGYLDDPSDFDLPSMFKTPAASSAADKPAPLLGRLSEAIRAASAGQNGDPLRAEPSLSTLKLHRVEAGDGMGAPHFLLSTFHEATTLRGDEHVIAGAASAIMQAPVASIGVMPGDMITATGADRTNTDHAAGMDRAGEGAAPAAAPQVPRQMAAFKDTRFRGMGLAPAVADTVAPFVSPFEATATAAIVAAVDLAAHPAPMAFADPSMAPMLVVDDLVAVEAPAGLTAAIVASYPSLAVEAAAVDTVVPVPPPVPAMSTAQPETVSAAPIEDSTADLLRPMLRQWLADNMPRMVEKALHIEVAESGKSVKK
jgi:hypothetical protein